MKYKICMIQQSVWKVKVQSVPLAMGYLKAYALQNKLIDENFRLEIYNFNLSHSNKHIINELLLSGIPDILCFSVQGWNVNNFVNICKYFKQLNPFGKIILGGVHVSNQGDKIFKMIPEADIISNGEGEITFSNLLINYLYSKFEKETLLNIKGISFVYNEEVVTTESQDLIKDLDKIPSPYINSIIPMRKNNGDYIYDAALLETSRGCPFQCSYCSWSQVMGRNEIRHFSLERLRKELIFFAENKIKDIVLCDSNFGLYKEDELFIDLFIEINEQYGYPDNIECSWASGIPETTLRIWEKLCRKGIKNNFSLALQSINSEVLSNIYRKNLSWEYLNYIKEWAKERGVEFFIELIWGLPGETIDSFVTNINKLSSITKRFAVYPLVVLPKSGIVDERKRFELKTIKETDNDFEYVVSNYSLLQLDNFRFTKYIFWIRLLSENMLFRGIWDFLQEMIGYTFFDVIISFTDFVGSLEPTNEFETTIQELTIQCDLHSKIPETILSIYSNLCDFKKMVYEWWKKCIISKISADYEDYFQEVIKYEMTMLPLISFEKGKYLEIGNYTYFIQENLLFKYDFLKDGYVVNKEKIKPANIRYDVRYRVGFQDFMYNQEFIPQHLGIVMYSKN